jgi:hypothetical protein
MPQITINIGTVANDGTGQTLRGAFSNTNSNFTELYNHHSNVTSNIVSVGVGANSWANTVAVAGNNYTNAVGAAGNNYINTIAVAGNNYANFVGAAGNNYINTIAVAGNSYTDSVGTAGNNYTNAVGAAGNNHMLSVATAGNNYTVIVGAAGNSYSIQVGAASNTWANSVGIASNSYIVEVGAASNTWANSNFTTLSNGASSFVHANAAFDKANNSLQNTSIYLNGSLNTSGTISDLFGDLRNSLVILSNDEFNTSFSGYLVSNTSNVNYVEVFEDVSPNSDIGTVSSIIQYGTGKTVIRPNTANVNIYSASGLNVSSQYAVAKLVKISSNTWIAYGDLSTL